MIADRISRGVWNANPTVVAYTGTAARNSTGLTPDVYYVNATTACHFLQGDNTVTATTSSNYLPAGAVVIVEVTNTTNNGFISFIQTSSSGSAYIMQPKGSP